MLNLSLLLHMNNSNSFTVTTTIDRYVLSLSLSLSLSHPLSTAQTQNNFYDLDLLQWRSLSRCLIIITTLLMLLTKVALSLRGPFHKTLRLRKLWICNLGQILFVNLYIKWQYYLNYNLQIAVNYKQQTVLDWPLVELLSSS